jgi:hypothetical protein
MMAGNKTDRKSGGFRALGTSLDKMTRPIFGKRGMADGSVALEWPRIVGESLAKVTLPERISYPKRDRRSGTLYLKVAGGSFATELIHFEPQLIERINRYFGYQAVSQVRIVQGPISHPTKTQSGPEFGSITPSTPNLSPVSPPDSSPNFDASLSNVSDPELLEALKSLGQAVQNRQMAVQNRQKTVQNRQKTLHNRHSGRHKTVTKS